MEVLVQLGIPDEGEARAEQRALRLAGIRDEKVQVAVRPERRIWVSRGHFGHP